MNFALGFITGLGASAVIFAILAFFRAGIEKRVQFVEKQLGNAGPKPKGAIIWPETDADIARRELIEKNNEAGVDTPLEDLM